MLSLVNFRAVSFLFCVCVPLMDDRVLFVIAAPAIAHRPAALEDSIGSESPENDIEHRIVERGVFRCRLFSRAFESAAHFAHHIAVGGGAFDLCSPFMVDGTVDGEAGEVVDADGQVWQAGGDDGNIG